MKFEPLVEAEIKEIKDDNIISKIINGDLDYIKNYFKKNPKHITYKLKYNQDLLSLSIDANQKQIFDWLLANGVKIVSNKNGFTAMHQSIYNNDTYYLKELIKYGGNINKKTKKTPSPIVLLLEEIMNRKYKEPYLPIFKELIKCGADLSVDLNGENIFINIVKHGIDVSFVKVMVDADKTLLKEKVKTYNGNHNMLDISLLNFNGDLVVYFMEQGVEIVSYIDAIIRFITNTVHTDAAMKLYNTLSDKFKENITIEEMLYRDNGKEKMFKLLEKGIKIFPSFIKNHRVIAIADELLATDRASELHTLGIENNVEAFMPQDVKDIFLF